MPAPPTRRELLSALAISAAAVPLLGTAACASAPRRVVSQGRLRHAGIGVGGMGWHDLERIAAHPEVDIVALCDVDANNLAKAAERFPDAHTYTDWRELLATEAGAIDSVHVTVPDHMHASIEVTALRAGLHVYGQKPLTRTVHESRVVAREARAAGTATQMGIQNRAGHPYRQALALFEQGHIGQVYEVHVWTDRPKGWWPQGVGKRPGSDPVPEHLAWDLWLGAAPERPYLEKIYHAFAWRGVLDFGTGAQGDMGCHLMDPALWFLGLDEIFNLRSDGPVPTDDTYPLWSRVRMEFAPTPATTRGPLVLVWHDGGRKAPRAILDDLGAGDDVYDNACLFLGTDGALLASPYEVPRLLPEARFADVPVPEVPDVDHWFGWVDACLGRADPVAPFSYASFLSETALLGNVALSFPHETLLYDHEGMAFLGRPEADAMLSSSYRPGWAVRGLG
ncbi:MAG: gfo/Idh/MocA family oxidoreductase [Planctomycetota bacterium]|nr:MAG: gfo/Idh/MocA family oxidoreductase [Planctomycetota bacterium]